MKLRSDPFSGLVIFASLESFGRYSKDLNLNTMQHWVNIVVLAELEKNPEMKGNS